MNIVNVNVYTMYTILFTVYTILGWSVAVLSDFFHALPAAHMAQPKTDAHTARPKTDERRV